MLLAPHQYARCLIKLSDRLVQAVVLFEEKNVNFVDARHAAWLLEQPSKQVYTFDQKHFRRFEHLQVVVPGETS